MFVLPVTLGGVNVPRASLSEGGVNVSHASCLRAEELMCLVPASQRRVVNVSRASLPERRS